MGALRQCRLRCGLSFRLGIGRAAGAPETRNLSSSWSLSEEWTFWVFEPAAEEDEVGSMMPLVLRVVLHK